MLRGNATDDRKMKELIFYLAAKSEQDPREFCLQLEREAG